MAGTVVESGEWRVESGEWRMENGEWRMENADRCWVVNQNGE